MTNKSTNPAPNLACTQGKTIRIHGFTLIELMIVVVVLGILAAIAFPSYTSQVQKTRRADATSALLGAAQQLERCYTRTSTYSGCLTFPLLSENRHYDVNTSTLSQTTYTLVATPRGSQKNDVLCQSFTLVHTGKRDADSSTDECWRR
jgi:type IV pilus assembly protein PilE